MSGPPYPPPRIPPSGIGTGFTIGISPIGTPITFDLWNTILSQYANSPILTQLIQNFFQYIDQTADFDAFFDNIWNIDTASGVGLDIWGRIVGVQRTVLITTGKFLGFKESSPYTGTDSWDQAPWFGGAASTSNYALTDQAFRTLILAKALANISDGSIKSINQILLNLFPGRGNCYATDGLNMTMTYTFNFALTNVEEAIVSQSGVLPKPAGVSSTIVISP